MRVLKLPSATAQMLPPRPPSPPSGPPRGMYFSRRKLAHPSPPLPAWISIKASSTNFMLAEMREEVEERGEASPRKTRRVGLLSPLGFLLSHVLFASALQTKRPCRSTGPL